MAEEDDAILLSKCDRLEALLDRISNELDYLRSRRDLCSDAYDIVTDIEAILEERNQ